MPQFNTRRRVHHSAGNMFDLVADVERYPEFVPLCKRLQITSRTEEGGNEIITARMMVAYKMLQETFTSRIVLNREAREIRVNYIDGPFRYLENLWTFKPIDNHTCEIGFRISYEFRSRILQTLMGAVFDTAFRKFAGAFEARADQVYGAASEKPLSDGPSTRLAARAADS